MDLLSINEGMFWWSLITFILLVLVLGKFAWKPLLGAVEQREKNIQDAVNSAETAKIEAEALLNQHKQLIADSEAKATELMRTAKEQAQKHIDDAKEDARQQAKKLIEQANAEIDRQKSDALKELRKEVANLAVQAASKIIHQELDTDKNRKLVDEYITKLPEN